MNKFAVVIPAYNEAQTIEQVVSGVLAYLDCVVVIDDGSTDGTAKKLEHLPVTVLRNKSNQGKAASLWRGMKWALGQGADAVITVDGDSQHRPEDIPRFIEASEADPGSIVIGSRLHEKDRIPASRYRANRFANFWVAWASGYPIEDSQTGFRLYPANFLADLQLDTSPRRGFVFESEILIEAGWRGISTVPVRIPAIYDASLRESHFQGVSDITKITMMITRRIVSRGFYLKGLYRSVLAPLAQRQASRGIDRDALWMLLVSLTTGILTLGLSHLYVLYRVIKTARKTPFTAGGLYGIVILGHALKRGNISADYQCRLDRAISLVKSNPEAAILVVGGLDHAGVSEAAKGAEYLQDQGMDSALVSTATQSTNTLDNLREAWPWIAQHERPNRGDSVVLISNRYHLERINTLASGIGLPVRPSSAEQHFSCKGIKIKLLIETFYLHWYWSGYFFAKMTGNQRMLNKIS